MISNVGNAGISSVGNVEIRDSVLEYGESGAVLHFALVHGSFFISLLTLYMGIMYKSII